MKNKNKDKHEIGPEELAEIKTSIRSKALPGTLSFHADELKPYAKNPRTEYIGLEDIRASMERDGYLAMYPIEIDGDTMEVLSGNTRLLAAQGLSDKWKKKNPLLAVVYKGLTDIEHEVIAIEGNENRFELSFFDRCNHVVRLIDEVGLSLRAVETLMSSVKEGLKKSQIGNYYRYGTFLAPMVLHAVDRKVILQNMAGMLATITPNGDLIWSLEEQQDIIEIIKYRQLGPVQFREFLLKFDKMRKAEWADKNQPRLSDFFPGEIEEYRSDEAWQRMMGDEQERVKREQARKLIPRIVGTILKGGDGTDLAPYIRRIISSAKSKGLDMAYARECLLNASAALTEALVMFDKAANDSETEEVPDGEQTEVEDEMGMCLTV
jgi:hypothetical protein